MPLLLICFSVIMLFSSSMSTEKSAIKDFSERCTKGRIIAIHLTTGIGCSDASVGFIASEKSLNCSLRYSVRPMYYIMLVLEFPDWLPNKKVCGDEKNFVHAVSDVGSENVCLLLDKTSESVYYKLGKSIMQVNIISERNMNTVKVTATAMRDSRNLSCSFLKEIECFYGEKLYCMKSEVLCDGHNNCGVKQKFDEDNKKCEGPSLTPKVIIFSIVMGGISFWLIISIAVTLLPKRKETFVYKINQSKSLFDSNKGHVAFDIDVKVLYPIEGKTEFPLLQQKSKETNKHALLKK